MSFGFVSNSSLKQAVRGATLGTATSSFVGAVRVDGTSIFVDVNGTISVVPVTTATSSAAGVVRPDGTSILITSGVISVSTVQTNGSSIVTNSGVLSLGSSITASWTIQQSSNGSLYFYHAGVAKFRLGTDGVFSATSNIGAFVTI